MDPRNLKPVEDVIADSADAAAPDVSTRLKSRIYSMLTDEAANEGALRPLPATHSEGRSLCVFEQVVAWAPVPAAAQTFNYCRVCHGRLIGERVENPPLFWEGCPYAQFRCPDPDPTPGG